MFVFFVLLFFFRLFCGLRLNSNLGSTSVLFSACAPTSHSESNCDDFIYDNLRPSTIFEDFLSVCMQIIPFEKTIVIWILTGYIWKHSPLPMW